jgi:hypothetical protein
MRLTRPLVHALNRQHADLIPDFGNARGAADPDIHPKDGDAKICTEQAIIQ